MPPQGPPKSQKSSGAGPEGEGPFQPGMMVLVSLGEPREKFWGVVLALSQAGLSIRGIDLQSFDDSAAMAKSGEPFTPTSVFFPMYRVERIELDTNSSGVPSLGERFTTRTGRDPSNLFEAPE